jgi:hypothetical protein
MKVILILATAVLLLTGCETAPVKEFREEVGKLFQRPQGAPQLAAGIRAYEDGRYNEAAKLIQQGLDAGLSRADRVAAHKYLAFLHCAGGRASRCRDEFRSALAIDPEFDLAPEEAGHPIWGPVFRSVKGSR